MLYPTLCVTGETAVSLVSGSSRPQGESSDGEGVEQGPQGSKSTTVWAMQKGQQMLLRCCNTLLCFCHHCHYLLAFILLHAYVSVRQVDSEYACCLAVIHGGDRSVHLLQNCVLTSTDVSIVTISLSLPPFLYDPRLRHISISVSNSLQT